MASCRPSPVSEVKTRIRTPAPAVTSTVIATISTNAAVTNRSTNSLPPSGRFIALVICGMSTAFRMPPDSSTRMKFGNVLADLNASPTTRVPSTAVCRDAFTMPRMRLAKVPDAISAELRARFLRSSRSMLSTSDSSSAGSAAVPAGPLGTATSCESGTAWIRRVSIWASESCAGSDGLARRGRCGPRRAARFDSAGASGPRGSAARRAGRCGSGWSGDWFNDRFLRRRSPPRRRPVQRRSGRPAPRHRRRRRPRPPRCGSRRC